MISSRGCLPCDSIGNTRWFASNFIDSKFWRSLISSSTAGRAIYAVRRRWKRWTSNLGSVYSPFGTRWRERCGQSIVQESCKWLLRCVVCPSTTACLHYWWFLLCRRVRYLRVPDKCSSCRLERCVNFISMIQYTCGSHLLFTVIDHTSEHTFTYAVYSRFWSKRLAASLCSYM